MKPLQSFIIFILAVTFASCTFTTARTNSEQDKRTGEKIADQFFSNVKKKDYQANYTLFSNQFWEVTNKEKMSNIFSMTAKKLGALKETTLGDWGTKVVSGTNPSAEYVLQYKNTYEKGTAVESLRLMAEGGKIKIVAYNINSDEFFK